MESKIQVRKIRKVPVQRVQIDLYKSSPSKVKKQQNIHNAVSKNVFKTKSTAVSPSITGYNTPQAFRFQNQQQVKVANGQLTSRQGDRQSTSRQGAKSTSKFHSRQSSVVRQSANLEKNRSQSPQAVFALGNVQTLNQKSSTQKIQNLQKQGSAQDQINQQNLLRSSVSRIKSRQASIGQMNQRDLLRLPNIQSIQQELEAQKTNRPQSVQKWSNSIQPTSRTLSTKQSLQASPEQTYEILKMLESQNEEKTQIMHYLQSYYIKHREMPISTPQLYNFIKLIGKGGFAKVALATHKLTGIQVAIKTINKKKIRDENHKRRIMQEAYMLRRINHMNVIKCFEMFETQKYIMIVMEYCPGGSMSKFLKQINRISEPQAKHIFRQIIKAIHCIHFNRILHRDVKPGNILFVQEFEGDINNYYPTVKICDFGTSTYVNYGERIHRQCGTPSYIAPEIAADQGYEGFNSDIWGLGVVLYELVVGTVPFKAESLNELKYVILAGEFDFPQDMRINQQVKELITQMLVLDPNVRIPIRSILKHA